MRNAQQLPPKMAQQYAERAKRGEATRHLGAECYLFVNGQQLVSLVSLNPPVGTVSKISKEEAERHKQAPAHDTPQPLPSVSV